MNKILIIDDSKVMRNIHKNTLKEHDIDETRFLEAENGAQALNLLMNNEVDFIIIDWNMPQMDGMQFVTKIRADAKYEKVPIIMVTSEAARENVMQAVKAGVTNYVVKPITGERLWQKFKDYIN